MRESEQQEQQSDLDAAKVETEELPHPAPPADQALTDRIAELEAELAARPEVSVPTLSPETIAHVHTLLTSAQERMSVNAYSTVTTYLDQAIKLLEG